MSIDLLPWPVFPLFLCHLDSRACFLSAELRRRYPIAKIASGGNYPFRIGSVKWTRLMAPAKCDPGVAWLDPALHCIEDHHNAPSVPFLSADSANFFGSPAEIATL